MVSLLLCPISLGLRRNRFYQSCLEGKWRPLQWLPGGDVGITKLSFSGLPGAMLLERNPVLQTILTMPQLHLCISVLA